VSPGDGGGWCVEVSWLYLALAIASEVAGTLGLRSLAGSFRWQPAVLIFCAYAVSFTFLWLALRTINVGAAYAIWSAVGTASIATLGVVIFGERVTWPAVIGMALIITGVVVLVGSGAARHT
jgi:small multidrug resistance pump